MSARIMKSHPADRPQEQADGNPLLRQGLVILALLGTLVINYLATALPINGVTPGDISDQFPVRFTPAGYVFSIWSLIYLGLSAYAVYQALPSQRHNPRLRAIARPFVLSCLANSLWIFAWHYGYLPVSLLLMLVLLGALITIYARLAPTFRTVTALERWTTHLPFRIYLGWITVATIANTTIVLYAQGWSGAPLSASVWAVILLGVVAVLGGFFALALRDAAYTLVLVWALIGIYVKQQDAPLVAYTAAGLALVLALAALYALVSQASAKAQSAA
jgi:benzodiazapine receptor